MQWGRINFIKKIYINSEPETLHNAEKFHPTFKIMIFVVAPCSMNTHYIFTVIKISYIIFILSFCLYLFMAYLIVVVIPYYIV
jgi:hypothetical protein